MNARTFIEMVLIALGVLKGDPDKQGFHPNPDPAGSPRCL
jgi:hypothetical protein